MKRCKRATTAALLRKARSALAALDDHAQRRVIDRALSMSDFERSVLHRRILNATASRANLCRNHEVEPRRAAILERRIACRVLGLCTAEKQR